MQAAGNATASATFQSLPWSQGLQPLGHDGISLKESTKDLVQGRRHQIPSSASTRKRKYDEAHSRSSQYIVTGLQSSDRSLSLYEVTVFARTGVLFSNICDPFLKIVSNTELAVSV